MCQHCCIKILFTHMRDQHHHCMSWSSSADDCLMRPEESKVSTALWVSGSPPLRDELPIYVYQRSSAALLQQSNVISNQSSVFTIRIDQTLVFYNISYRNLFISSEPVHKLNQRAVSSSIQFSSLSVFRLGVFKYQSFQTKQLHHLSIATHSDTALCTAPSSLISFIRSG